MKNDFCALCAELLREFSSLYSDMSAQVDFNDAYLERTDALITRARAALSHTEDETLGSDGGYETGTMWTGHGIRSDNPSPSEGPTDEEILRMAAKELGYEFTNKWFLTGGNCPDLETNPCELLNFARAALTQQRANSRKAIDAIAAIGQEDENYGEDYGETQRLSNAVQSCLSQREEILSAFIAKYGFHPEMAVQIEQRQADGTSTWRIEKRPSPLTDEKGPTDEDFEEAAKLIHASMRFAVPDNQYTRDWVERGNSLMQDIARRTARSVLARWGRPVASPAGDGPSLEVLGPLIAWLTEEATQAADEDCPKTAGMLTWAAQVVGERVDEDAPWGNLAPAPKPTPPAPEVEEGPSDDAWWHELVSEIARVQHVAAGEGQGPRFDLAEAVARWCHPTPQPIPLSERTPEMSDCNVEGMCWTTNHNPSLCYSPVWSMTDHPSTIPAGGNLKDFRKNYFWRNVNYWLPYWALPIPTDDSKE